MSDRLCLPDASQGLLANLLRLIATHSPSCYISKLKELNQKDFKDSQFYALIQLIAQLYHTSKYLNFQIQRKTESKYR